MSRPSRLLALAAVLSLLFVAAPKLALASPDAKVDQQIRPCFGLLIEPNLSRGCKTSYRPKPKPCPRGTYRVRGRCETPVRPPVRQIDCSYAYPGQISDALARLYDGDVLTLVSSRGGACVESLNITQSVTIVTRGYEPALDRPILVAPAGQPCIRIAPGVAYVVLAGLGIEALRAGQASCITGRATELALKDVTVRYDGEASALEIGDSRLKDIRITRLGDWSGSSRTRNSAGFVLSGMNRQQLVQIEGLNVDGFSRGIYISGGDETTLLRPVVRDSDWAVTLEDGDLRVLDGQLEAVDVGLYADSGTLYAADNKIVGVMRAGLYAEKGAQIRARDNRVFARPGGCEALVTGHFDGALTCQPWFEAPELFRTPRDRARMEFDSYWPVSRDAPPSPTIPAPASLSGAPQAGGKAL